MSVGDNIRKIREQHSMLQKQVAGELGLDKSSYSKLEKGLREVRVAELQKLSSLFEMSIDQIVNFEGDIPQEVTLADKSENEQIKLFNQLDEEDKKAVFHIIDKMLTQKKFREFFQENIG